MWAQRFLKYVMPIFSQFKFIFFVSSKTLWPLHLHIQQQKLYFEPSQISIHKFIFNYNHIVIDGNNNAIKQKMHRNISELKLLF